MNSYMYNKFAKDFLNISKNKELYGVLKPELCVFFLSFCFCFLVLIIWNVLFSIYCRLIGAPCKSNIVLYRSNESFCMLLCLTSVSSAGFMYVHISFYPFSLVCMCVENFVNVLAVCLQWIVCLYCWLWWSVKEPSGNLLILSFS